MSALGSGTPSDPGPGSPGSTSDPFIVFGMVVRPVAHDEIDVAAGLLRPPRNLPAYLASRLRTPREAAEAMAGSGHVFIVEDDERRPMGLVSMRPSREGTWIGWHLADGYLGKGLGSILVEGVTERLLRSGAAAVWSSAAPGATGARRTLETLGYVSDAPGARPLRYGVDAAMFEARKRRGTALLPNPAERRRGPSPKEQGLLLDGDGWIRPVPPRPSARIAFSEPFEGDGLILRLASTPDLDAALSVVPVEVRAPDGILSGDERSDLVRRNVEDGKLLLATDADGTPVGSVSIAVHKDGRHELGWYVAEARRGEGVATWMASATAARLFEAGIGRISCATDPANAASIRIAEGLGFSAGRPGPDGSLRFELDASGFTPPPPRGRLHP